MPSVRQPVGQLRRDISRIELDGVLETVIEGKPAPKRRDDGLQSVRPEDAGRAAAPMQPRDPRLFADKTGDELDFGFQRTAIGGDHVVANRHLGVAAAIEADLAAIGHMQIDRNALAGDRARPKPSRMLRRRHRQRREIRRSRVGSISRYVEPAYGGRRCTRIVPAAFVGPGVKTPRPRSAPLGDRNSTASAKIVQSWTCFCLQKSASARRTASISDGASTVNARLAGAMLVPGVVANGLDKAHIE